MRARAAGQLRRGEAEHVAAGAFDVNDLGAEFSKLGAGKRLGDELTGADHADAFERPEGRNEARRRRPFQALDPVRDGFPELLDPVFAFDQPRVMRHVRLPSMCVPGALTPGITGANSRVLLLYKARLKRRSGGAQPRRSERTKTPCSASRFARLPCGSRE